MSSQQSARSTVGVNGLRNWLLDRRFQIGFSLAIVPLIVAAILGMRDAQALSESMRWVNHTHEVKLAAHTLLSALVNVETGARGFVLTGDERFLDPYYQGKKVVQNSLNELRVAMQDNLDQISRVMQLTPDVEQRVAMAARMVEFRKTHDLLSTLNQFDLYAAKAVMDRVRGIVAQLISDEESLLRQRQAVLQVDSRAVQTGITLANALAVLIVAGAALAFYKEERRRRRAEGELRKSYDELERRVAERTSDLASAQRRAETANRVKDEFLAMVSHELRTPLNAQRGWLHVLERTMSTEPEKARRALGGIQQATEQQTRLVEDLLDSARIISGKLRLELRPTRVREVAEAALNTVRLLAQEKSIRLETAFASDNLSVLADPHRLQQVLLNLLTNAIKFTPAGGDIKLEARRAAATVQIVISDTGEGIKEEFLPHVFEPFRQVDGADLRRHGGLGLGLAIVKDLVVAHRGEVSVASPGANQGTSVTVTIPVAPKIHDTHCRPRESGEP
jgi:signal transduction histidine kinase